MNDPELWSSSAAARAAMTNDSLPPKQLDADQVAFISAFIENYKRGRSFLCLFVHSMVALGIILGGISAFIDHILNSRAHWWN